MTQRRREQDNGYFKCPDCGQWLNPVCFYANKRTLDGISTYCKDCHKERQKYYSPKAKRERRETRDRKSFEALADQLQEYVNHPERYMLGPPEDPTA